MWNGPPAWIRIITTTYSYHNTHPISLSSQELPSKALIFCPVSSSDNWLLQHLVLLQLCWPCLELMLSRVLRQGAAFTSFSTVMFKFGRKCKKRWLGFLPSFHISSLRYNLFFWEICTEVQIHEWSTDRLANLFQWYTTWATIQKMHNDNNKRKGQLRKSMKTRRLWMYKG